MKVDSTEANTTTSLLPATTRTSATSKHPRKTHLSPNAMDNKTDPRSGYTSPDVPPTPATSHKLKRSASNETVATTLSIVSSAPSLNYPIPPHNTPATQSVAGEYEHLAKDSIAPLHVLAQRLSLTTPPSSPPSTLHAHSSSRDRASHKHSSKGKGEGEEEEAAAAAAVEEGKPHLTSSQRPASPPAQRPFKPAPLARRKRDSPMKPLLSKLTADRQPTPTRLSEVMSHGGDSEAPVFEYSAWAVVAEEDTMRALQRMAMLARDEHAKDPRHSVEQHYTARLARLIDEAEVGFDYGFVGERL